MGSGDPCVHVCVCLSQLRANRGYADWTTMTLYDMFQLLVDEEYEAARQGGGEGRRVAGGEGERRGAS